MDSSERRKYYQSTRDILDLFEYLDTLGEDRPPVGAMFKLLAIDPTKMSSIVCGTARTAVVIQNIDVAIEAVNDLFKTGITIGYKYAVAKQMEKDFGFQKEEKDKKGEEF